MIYIRRLNLKVRYPKALVASFVFSLVVVGLLWLVQPYMPTQQRMLPSEALEKMFDFRTWFGY